MFGKNSGARVTVWTVFMLSSQPMYGEYVTLSQIFIVGKMNG